VAATVRQPGKVAIIRAVIGDDTDRIRTLVRTHPNPRAHPPEPRRVSATEARMLRRIAAGTTPQNLSNPEAVALGVLANPDSSTPPKAAPARRPCGSWPTTSATACC
jgi:hypothetical protein